MGTSDTRPGDGPSAGGIGTITRPGAGPEAGSVARRGRPRPAATVATPRVPPQRTGRPGGRRSRQGGPPGEPRQAGRSPQSLAPDTAPRRVADGPLAAARGMPLRTQRMPFFLVLCVLLGGALVSALVISTTLAEGSYQITRLQQANSALARERQMLQAQVAAAQSAQVIERRALELGMRPVRELRFLNLENGKIQTDAGSGQVRDIHVPGYTP